MRRQPRGPPPRVNPLNPHPQQPQQAQAQAQAQRATVHRLVYAGFSSWRSPHRRADQVFML